MRNFRDRAVYRSSRFLSLQMAIAVACLAPAASTQVQSRGNYTTPAPEKTTPVATSPNAGSHAQSIDADGQSARVPRASTFNQKTESGTAPPPTLTPPIFLAPAIYATGDANAVASADLNGDGKPDLVVANCAGSCSIQAEGTISVLLGNGDGTFQSPVNYPSGGMLPTSVQIADINLDGKPDIVILNESDGVSMLLGNGDGTFQPPVLIAGSGSQQVLVADLNHDGKPDVVVLSGQVGVLLGNGDGTFQPMVNYEECCIPSNSLALADVNGDGTLDLLVDYWGAIGIRLGNGDGTFQSESSIALGVLSSWLAAGDVNGDGHIDLAWTHSCLGGCTSFGTVSVMLGNGDGTFQAPVAYGWEGYGATSVAIADINGDGKSDLVIGGADCNVTCGLGLGGIGVLLGNGDGTFQATLPYTPFNPIGSQVLVQDVNGDNRPDVISIPTGIDTYIQVWLHVGNIHTTTGLSSSLNPSVFGQPLTMTAKVHASTGAATGTVELFDNSYDCPNRSNDCGGVALSSGSAVFSHVLLPAGSNSLIGAYQGSLTFNSSTSPQLNQVVQMASTTTAVVSSLNPATPAKKFTYTATVAGQYGGGISGSVTFSDGGTTLGTVATAPSGQATVGVSNQSCGIHPITTTYSGDANNNASTSQTLNEQVQCSTSTSLTTSGSPTFVGQPVTFTATVKSKYGAIPNGELVTFYDGKTALASVALVGQTAAYTTSTLSAKSHVIAATYAGDAGFTPSTARITQNVVKYATATTVSSSLNPSAQGQPVTFTANVTSAGGPVPTGKVAFRNGVASLGTVVLSGGVATITKSSLPIGTDAITADYLGDADSAVSKSATLNQVVQ